MNEQDKILQWWADNHPGATLSRKDAYEKYQKAADYEGELKTFGNLLGELANDKQLLDRPSHGEYRINHRGKQKAAFIGGDHDTSRARLEQFYTRRRTVKEMLREQEGDIAKAAAGGQPLTISVAELDRYEPDTVDAFEENPGLVLDAIEEAAQTVGEQVADTALDVQIDVDVNRWERHIVSARSAENIGTPVTVTGTIQWARPVAHEIVEATFECEACAAEYKKEQDDASAVKSPYECNCGNKKFEEVDRLHDDVIWMRIGNQHVHNEDIRAVFRTRGIDPATKDAFTPGNTIRATGIIHAEPKGDDTPETRPYLDVIAYEERDQDHAEITDGDVEEIRDTVAELDNPFATFAESVAPHIVDADAAKRVAAAALLGGVDLREGKDGRLHAFIVGNPGTGKSDILNYVAEVFSDAHYAVGSSATGTGLTGAAEQVDGKWTLKAGKLVYANGGLLALDEYDKMKAGDAKKLNEAMGKGTFTIDKASIHTQLPGAATVLAAGNFAGDMDGETLEEGERIRDRLPEHPASTRDRFDLIYAMDGTQDAAAVMAAHFNDHDDAPLTAAQLRAYRHVARNIDPDVSDAARTVIEEWMAGEREIAASRGNTVFQTESNRYMAGLIKLTTMFARSRFSDTATEQDAERAVQLLMECRRSHGFKEGET